MFRFCFLAMLLSLPLEGFGDLVCEAEIAAGPGRPIDGVNNYRSYAYDSDAANECNNLQVSCSASIVPNYTLTGRSWYITNIRPHHGLFYDDRVIQDFRVQCPRGTFLHLALQNSSLPSGDPFANGCEDTDFVRVNAEGLTESIFCGDYLEAQRRAPDLFNFGRGRIITNGRASISFCSDNVSPEVGDTFDGFVVRATCINPAEFQLPSCVDYPFFAAWDPQFTRIIEDLPPVERAMFNHGMQSASTPGKRAAERKKRMANREKRFLSTFGQQVLILEPGDFIQYSDDTLTITKNDTDGQTSETIGAIFLVAAEAARIGTRYFAEDAPLTFFGPGRVDIEGVFATIRYTIPEEEIESSFLPRPSITQAANLIHQYIFNNWVRPYPVIDSMDRSSMFDSLPLPPGEEPPLLPGMNNPLLPVSSLGFVREDIAMSRCFRAVRIFDAPTIKSRLPLQLTKFCQFFSHSCDLILRHACQDANRLDPASVGK